MANTSATYFSAKFKKVGGINFVDYVARTRVGKARTLFFSSFPIMSTKPGQAHPLWERGRPDRFPLAVQGPFRSLPPCSRSPQVVLQS